MTMWRSGRPVNVLTVLGAQCQKDVVPKSARTLPPKSKVIRNCRPAGTLRNAVGEQFDEAGIDREPGGGTDE